MIINGDMRVAQYAANNTAINTYGPCDRWRSYGGPLGLTISQQSSSDYESGYCLRFHRTASNSQTNNTGFTQGIETLNSRGLAGKTVTLSFKAKCGANFSPTSSILYSRVNGGEGTDENPVGMTNTNGDSQANTLTTSVQTFSFSYAVPSDKTQVSVLFDCTPTGTAGADDWFEVGDVQLEIGSTATDFEHRSYGEELALCQRYYEKSYNHGTAPGSTTNDGLIAGSGAAGQTTTGELYTSNGFAVPKRTTPTMTIYDGSGNSGKCNRINLGVSTSTNQTAGSLYGSQGRITVNSSSGDTASAMSYHYEADAEL
tara:strand:- start:53 stop:994 length:942 start_codon:yes stop_codon:yes gene_type:complete